MNKTTSIIIALIFVSLAFTLGYKIGDSRGYADGYNEGYRYDCKEEIGNLYRRVKDQSKALDYTDSLMKLIFHENDSLKRQEYYKNRHADSLAWREQFSKDSLKYAVVARKYSDSLNKVVRGHALNIIQADGNRNIFVCTMLKEYRDLDECQDGFDVKSRLDKMLKKGRKGKKK